MKRKPTLAFKTKSLRGHTRTGKIHAYDSGDTTVCGIELTEYWLLEGEEFGKVNCEECLKIKELETK